MRKSDIITGIGFFTTLIGFAGLAEAFSGNGRTDIAMGIVVVGIALCASQTIREEIESVKESKSNIANYPFYLERNHKHRRRRRR